MSIAAGAERVLKSLKAGECCWLVGLQSGTGVVLSCIKSDCWAEGAELPSPKWKDEEESLSTILPSGIRPLGVCLGADSLDLAKKFLSAQKPALLGSSPIAAVSSNGEVSYSVDMKVAEGLPSELTQQHALLRCSVPLRFQLLHSSNGFKDCVLERASVLEEQLSEANCYFALPSGKVYAASTKERQSIKDAAGAGFFEASGSGGGKGGKDSKGKKSKKKGQLDDWDDDWGGSSASTSVQGSSANDEANAAAGPSVFDSDAGKVVDVELLTALASAGPASEAAAAPALAAASHKGGKELTANYCTATLDAVVYVKRDAPVGESLASLRAALAAQLTELFTALADAGGASVSAAAYHFLPSSHVAHLVPQCYALPGTGAAADFEGKDAALLARRQALHARFMLPDDAPCFRSGCAVPLVAGGAAYDRLLNVHESCPDSGVPGGVKHLVKGPYLYYHYMQDKFNDKGWGCAYRSLQTVWSWYFLNHYTLQPVPSHKEIQECLVKIGDKGRSFIGSKQWIGSTEVGYCLDEMLGLKFRVIMSSTGPGLVEKGRELAKHFDEVGTPIMMGGGALAFTLLGVDFNAGTGEIKFLILDPHYCGGEDIDTITKKDVKLEGYSDKPCGWRSADTFDKHSFYNLCVPERPKMI